MDAIGPMGLRHLLVAAAGAALLGVSLYLSCPSGMDVLYKSESHEEDRGRRYMQAVLELTADATRASRSPPPTNARAFGRWLVKWVQLRMHNANVGVNTATGEVLDYWGRPVVLLVQERALVGMGSCGMDGTWADGEGDDITVSLVDVDD